MNLSILIPFEVFAKKTEVARLVVETTEGSYGFLPHRLDCVAALTPGILNYEVQGEAEVFIAVDDGVLVKSGLDVLVSVRRAIYGSDLSKLRDAVEKEFLSLDESQKSIRSATEQLEAGFLRRLANLHHE